MSYLLVARSILPVDFSRCRQQVLISAVLGILFILDVFALVSI
jgi:hypothetical protein